MNLYWLYDLPCFLFALIIIGFFTGFSAIGLYVHRRFVLRLFGRHPHNDMVSYYLAAVGVFYGITLGLISVGTYTTYSDCDSKVSTEATTVSALYSDISSYPHPIREELKKQLSDYTNLVIDVVWPEQRKGHLTTVGYEKLQEISHTLVSFEPTTAREQIVHAEALRQLSQLLQLNNGRLQSVSGGLPLTMYVVIVVGALLNIMVSWLFIIDNVRLHNALNMLMAALLGLLVFLISAMDNPFRGGYSVGSDAFEFTRDHVINQEVGEPKKK